MAFVPVGVAVGLGIYGFGLYKVHQLVCAALGSDQDHPQTHWPLYTSTCILTYAATATAFHKLLPTKPATPHGVASAADFMRATGPGLLRHSVALAIGVAGAAAVNTQLRRL